MVKMYNTDLKTNITEEVKEYKRGNWISMVSPSDEEIKMYVKILKLVKIL